MLAELIRSVQRPTDPHVAIARRMAADEAAYRGTGTAAIVRRRRAQEATTVIIARRHTDMWSI